MKIMNLWQHWKSSDNTTSRHIYVFTNHNHSLSGVTRLSGELLATAPCSECIMASPRRVSGRDHLRTQGIKGLYEGKMARGQNVYVRRTGHVSDQGMESIWKRMLFFLFWKYCWTRLTVGRVKPLLLDLIHRLCARDAMMCPLCRFTVGHKR